MTPGCIPICYIFARTTRIFALQEARGEAPAGPPQANLGQDLRDPGFQGEEQEERVLQPSVRHQVPTLTRLLTPDP